MRTNFEKQFNFLDSLTKGSGLSAPFRGASENMGAKERGTVNRDKISSNTFYLSEKNTKCPFKKVDIVVYSVPQSRWFA